MCVAPLCGSRVATCPTNLYDYCGRTRFCLLKVWLRSSLWFLECEGLCFAEPSWNISPAASCSGLARPLSVAMFRASYTFSHAWPSLQSSSAAGAMATSWVQLHWCYSPPGVVCEAWAWEVQAPRPLRRTTTCSRCPSMSSSTTWHRLAVDCWMSCDVCLWRRSDVDCVWRRYFSSRVFSASWTFVRPPDIVARDTLSWIPDIHTPVSYTHLTLPTKRIV